MLTALTLSFPRGSATRRGFVVKKIESLTVSELNSYVLNFPLQVKLKSVPSIKYFPAYLLLSQSITGCRVPLHWRSMQPWNSQCVVLYRMIKVLTLTATGAFILWHALYVMMTRLPELLGGPLRIPFCINMYN